jgi:hypothetical protein
MLDKRTAPVKANRVLPPVSEATGGLMPGIDLNDAASLEAAEIEVEGTLSPDRPASRDSTSRTSLPPLLP